MQYRIRQAMLQAAIVATLLGGGALADAEGDSKLDLMPSTPGEWETVFVGHVYDAAPASEAQERQASMGSFLKHLGLERLWQVTGERQVQEGWYSASLGVTVVTKASVGATASLSARVMDGQVNQQAALLAAGQ